MPTRKAKQPRNLVRSVMEKLLIDIADGQLKAGDVLPPEPELARQLRVSRPTLRQALKPLENAGILRPRPRRGTVLCEADPGALGPLFGAHMALAGVSEAHAAEARLVFEEGMARLAARRRTPEDLSAMRAALEEEQAAGGDLARCIQAERHFHGAIVTAAHNPVLSSLRQILTLYFDQRAAQGRREQDPAAARRTHEAHHRIYDAVAEGNAEVAAALMRTHLEPSLAIAGAAVNESNAGEPRDSRP